MAEDSQIAEEGDQQEKFSLITVPENLIQQVAEHVISLEQEKSDVSGHMISGLGRIGTGLRTLSAGWTGTGCKAWTTGSQGTDHSCSDDDK